MFEYLYPSNLRNDELYVQCSLIPHEGGNYPSSLIEKLDNFCDKIVPQFCNKSRKQKVHAWYRPVLRTKAGKPKLFTAVWLDVDVIKDKIDVVALNNTLETMPHPPSIIVWSGGGYHLYWLLDTPSDDMEAGKCAIRGLAQEMGCKCDPQQLDWGVENGGLRIPGSFNWKREAECLVQTINMKGEDVLRYSLEDLPKLFPEEKKTEEKKKPGRKAKISAKTVEELMEQYFPEEDIEKKQWCVSCPFHEDDKPSLSINPHTGNWTCRSERHEGVKQGGVVSFYAKMERITIAQGMRDLKFIEKDNSLVKNTMETIITDVFEPLYQDGDLIIGHIKESGEICELDMSSNVRVLNSLANVLRASPEQVAESMLSGEFHNKEDIMDGYRQAFHNLLQTIPSKSNLTVLGQGIHHTTNKGAMVTLLVDGRDMYQFDYEKLDWVKEERLPILGQFLPKEADKWYPFWKKEYGNVRTPEQVYKEVYEIVRAGWGWQNELDPHLISLFTCYCWYFGWFGRPLSIFVTGQSHSGKSALTEGFFAGNRHGSVGLVAGSLEFKDTSLAGFFQSASHQSRLVVFDELYDSNTKHAKEIVSSMRNLDAQNNKVVRGTKHGKPIEFPLNFPAIWSAIKSPELEQDANRQIFITLKRKKGAIDPWKIILGMKTREQLERLRAELPIFLLQHRGGVLSAAQTQETTVNSMEFRKGQQLLPLIQIASICGVDLESLTKLMTGRAAEEDVEIRADSFDSTLMTIIMQQDLPTIMIDEDTALCNVSVSEKIRNGQDFSSSNCGIYYREKRKQLFISAPIILNKWLGNMPRFRDMTERSLANLFRTMPGYVKSDIVNLGKDCGTKRCHIFDVDPLMEIWGTATEEVPEERGLLT